MTGRPETARTLVVNLVCIGAEWAATSAHLPGGKVYGDSREAVEAAARKALGRHVTLEFRELGPRPD